MKTIEAAFRIVSPMFIGGATPVTMAELRPPSIKGLLRFWWRVFESPIVDGDIRKLAEIENRIFGGPWKGQGQSIFAIKIIDHKEIKYGAKGDGKWNKTPIAYMGYGAITRDRDRRESITTRSFIESGYFTIILQFKPLAQNSSSETIQSHENDIMMVKRAFWAMCMFGGIGARSRKGFGSIVPTSVKGMDDLPAMINKDHNELEKSLKSFLQSSQKAHLTAKYTCFSNRSRCVILGINEDSENFSTGEESLKWLGKTILSFRSYRGSNRKPWAIADHDLVEPYVRIGNPPHRAPDRSIFGLPHNYFYSSLRSGAELNIFDNGKKGRRASPLFFKVYQFEKSKMCCVIAMFLPSQFLPKDVKLTYTKENKEFVYVDPPTNFGPIIDLMDELKKINGKEVSWATI